MLVCPLGADLGSGARFGAAAVTGLGALGAAAADNGVYIVTTPGTAGTAFILTRAPSFQQGMAVAGYTVEVSEGTLFGGATFKLTTTGAITLDTTGLAFYPRAMQVAGTLVNATLAMTALYVGPNAKLKAIFAAGAPVNPGFLRVSASASVAPGTGTATVTSTSGTDASPITLEIINF